MPKISSLPAATDFTGAEQFPVVQGGQTRRGTAAQLAAIAAAGSAAKTDLANEGDATKGAAMVARAIARVEAITLASSTGLRNGDVIYAKGRTAAGDGGGGLFTYYSSGVQTVDGGFIFAPVSGPGRFVRENWTVLGVSGGIVNGAWFGVSAASADNIAAMTAAASAAVLYGLNKLELPAGTLTIKQGFVHLHGLHVFGAGKDKTIVRCAPDSANYATATCWHMGTYGPGNASQGTPKHETGYTFSAAVIGADSVTLTTPSEAGNFAVGDLASIEGSTLNANTLNTPNEMAIVVSANAGTGVVKFDAGLLSDYPTGAATLKIRKLNTGAPSTTSMVAANPGLTAYALRGGRLSDLTLTATVDGYSALNLSCFDCDFERVNCIGYNSIAGNPAARNRFIECQGLFLNAGFEPAYLSHNTFLKLCRFVRTAAAPIPGNAVGLWVNNGEGAKYITFEDVTIIDDDPAATSAHGVVEINGEGNKFIRGTIYSTRATESIQCGSGALVDGTTILKSGGNGILPAGTGATIINCRIFNTPAGKNAILLPTSAVRNLIANNDIGRGTKVAADSINDTATAKNNIRRDNRTFYTKDRSYTTFPNTLTGTLTETTRASLAYAAGTVDVGHYFDVQLSGICAGAGGTKTIKLKADAVTAVTLTLPATGAFDLRGRIGCSQGSQTWFYDLIANVGGVATPFVGTFNDNIAASTGVSITEQLSNTGDSITTYMCEIRAVNESASLS